MWLIFAPAVLGYDGAAAANDRLVGPVVAGSAFIAIWEVLRAVRWAAAPFGVWLLVAPFVLGYPDAAATVSSLVVGVVVVATTPPGKGDAGRFDGGWRSLIGDSRSTEAV